LNLIHAITGLAKDIIHAGLLRDVPTHAPTH